MKYKLYIDGASRGNPGPGGAGAYLIDSQGNEIFREAKFLGTVTNNTAEYSALIVGVESAKQKGIKELEIYADSELMVRQVKGIYKVKSIHLKKLYIQAMKLLKDFDYTMTHIYRDKNKIADQLANEAVDQHLEK